MLWSIGLITFTFLFYSLPFLPGYIEYKLKTDALPLAVNVDPTVVEYLLRSFRAFILRNFLAKLTKINLDSKTVDGKFSNGMEYQINCDKGLLSKLPSVKVLILCRDVTLPDNTVIQRVYAQQNLNTGKYNKFFSLYAEHSLYINSFSIIQNIAFSGNELTIAENCQLFGFLKAGKRICLNKKNKFQCIVSPIIFFGDCFYSLSDDIKFPKVFFEQVHKIDILDDYTFTADKIHQHHYVFRKKVIIPDHCEIIGNIKSYDDIKIGKNVKIFGSIISEKNIDIDDKSFILGPIVTNKNIHLLGKDIKIGTQVFPTSVIANFINIDHSAVIFGAILARYSGVFA
jgi:predicted acyltransferase (DUF342 family)